MALPNTFTSMLLNETFEDSLIASAAILQYQRVQLMSDGSIQPATNIADESIGTARHAIANANIGVVRLHGPMQFGLANANINTANPVAISTGGLLTPTLANTTSVVGVAKTPTNGGSNMGFVYYSTRRGVLAA